MARRVGAEVILHYATPPQQYRQKSEPTLVGRYTGCWVEPEVTADGAGGHANVYSSKVELWIPHAVEVHDSEDFFVWERYPDDKYETTGKVKRLHTRRGQLRVSIVPAQAIS